MKPRILFISLLAFSFILASSAYAALTVSPSLPTKSLTENEQVTVSVTVTNTAGSSTETSIVTSLSSGSSWFSVVTACSSINSLSAGQSGTSTCIIKPTSTGSDLSLTASSTSQGGTEGQGTTSGINVASQSSSLTASVTADSSVSTGATFYVGATVTAPSANDVTNARATLTESGQCTLDTSYVAAAQNLGNITKGTSKSPTNWKLTASSASGTCTATVNVVSDVGGTASPSKSITVSSSGGGSSSSSSSSSGGGGGGGGGGETTASKIKVTTGVKNAVAIITSIAAKSEANISVSVPTLALTELRIRAANTVTNIQITINRLDSIPTGVLSDAPGVVNQYIEIRPNASIAAADVEGVTINFNLEKSWLTSNNINESTIMLYRYVNDKWAKLSTSKTSDDSTNVYYQSTSPGLSIFAVAGEAPKAAAGQTTGAPGSNVTTPGSLGALAKGFNLWIFLGFVLLFGAGVVLFLVKNGIPKLAGVLTRKKPRS